MHDLLAQAERIATRLKARGDTVAVAESSAGGLISAALLATPSASAFFLGGAVVYTKASREGLLGITTDMLEGIRPSTEDYALLLAKVIRHKLAATWAIAETGAAGPAGNRYGDAAGHACFAIAGPAEYTLTMASGHADRVGNMQDFAAAALDLLLQALAVSPAP